MKTLMDLALELQKLIETSPIDHDCKWSPEDGCATCEDLNDLHQIAQRNLKANQALVQLKSNINGEKEEMFKMQEATTT